MQNTIEEDSFGEKTITLGNWVEKAAEGKVSHSTSEHTGALTDESSAWGTYRILELPRFVFCTEFHDRINRMTCSKNKTVFAKGTTQCS